MPERISAYRAHAQHREIHNQRLIKLATRDLIINSPLLNGLNINGAADRQNETRLFVGFISLKASLISRPKTTQFLPALKIRSKTSWNLVLPAPPGRLLLTQRPFGYDLREMVDSTKIFIMFWE